jgi:hypothetical protein
MPTKRAFHTALHLTSSNGEDDLILIFYGLHKPPTTATPSTEASSDDHSPPQPPADNTHHPRLAQCFHIDYYNINTNHWSTLTLTPPLDHNIFHLYNNQLNRTSHSRHTTAELIKSQLAMCRLLVSVKSVLYILNDNCVRCYDFDSALRKLIPLPYFQLHISNLNNVNNFVISATTTVTSTTALINMKSASFSSNGTPCYVGSGSEPSLDAMLFTWYSQTNSEDSSTASSSLSTSEVSSPTMNNNTAGETESASSSTANNDPGDDGEVVETRLFVKEALVYLFDTQNSVVYEFYPAKNKLKKLPPLLHRHSFDPSVSSMIFTIKSKVYVAGALAGDSSSNSTLIEVYDPDTNSWSVFINKLEDALDLGAGADETVVGELNDGEEVSRAAPGVPLMKHFFKLKMSLF